MEASDLSLVLRSGSLPAGIVYLEERTVGPSLGADSIRQGLIAGLAGLLAVVAVMLIYYRGSGVNATVALVMNSVILVAVLSYFGAVLTLPGIAGVILTIGMAVDSNVLIFERIREELRSGKAIVAAVDTGFSRAFLTIIDTHVTTVVSCAFLFMFGTGPVKGFAVTLVIGLLANVFTAVFVSKVIFDWHLSRQRQVQSLSI
jgi:preprotein translocase subunit SecD